MVNYFVACGTGLLLYDGEIVLQKIPEYPWFLYALALGSLFIGIFNLMAWTTQRSGLSVVSVATKMSVVVPILFGLLYYGESLGAIKLVGILLALVAVYLASVKTKSGLPIDRKNILYPAMVFLGSGVIDTSIKYLENTYVENNEVPLFSSTVFFSAAVIGISILFIQKIS